MGQMPVAVSLYQLRALGHTLTVLAVLQRGLVPDAQAAAGASLQTAASL